MWGWEDLPFKNIVRSGVIPRKAQGDPGTILNVNSENCTEHLNAVVQGPCLLEPAVQDTARAIPRGAQGVLQCQGSN